MTDRTRPANFRSYQRRKRKDKYVNRDSSSFYEAALVEAGTAHLPDVSGL